MLLHAKLNLPAHRGKLSAMDPKWLRPTIWRSIQTPHGNASWAVIDGVLYLRSMLGNKTTQVGNSDPEMLARCLMAELAKEQKPD